MMMTTSLKREDYPTCEDFPTLVGKQSPLHHREAPGDHELGRKTIELARRAGVKTFPWQRNDINAINARNPDGSWVHTDGVIICSRQNGKSLTVVLVVLFRIFVLGQSVLFTAQEWATAKELWEHTWKIVRGRRFLLKLVTSHTCSQGRGTIFLSNGGKVVFTTRSQDAGRGLTKIDLIIYDEAYNLTDGEIAATAFLVQAAEDPQALYTSSAVHKDFPQHQNGHVLSSMRQQALEEWDPEEPIFLAEYAARPGLDPELESTWREGNPSFGVISTPKKMRAIMKRMNTESGRVNFGVEALGWGSWFDESGEDDFAPVISDEKLNQAMTGEEVPLEYAVISFDVTPDRSKAAVAIAGKSGGLVHGAVGYFDEYNRSSLLEVVKEVISGADPVAILVDPKSPAEALIHDLEQAGFDVQKMTFPQVKSACAAFLDGVDEGTYSISESQEVRDGIGCAELREDKDGGVAWARRSGDICQLVALSNAMWGVAVFAPLKANYKNPSDVSMRRVKAKRENFAF